MWAQQFFFLLLLLQVVVGRESCWWEVTHHNRRHVNPKWLSWLLPGLSWAQLCGGCCWVWVRSSYMMTEARLGPVAWGLGSSQIQLHGGTWPWCRYWVSYNCCQDQFKIRHVWYTSWLILFYYCCNDTFFVFDSVIEHLLCMQEVLCSTLDTSVEWINERPENLKGSCLSE